MSEKKIMVYENGKALYSTTDDFYSEVDAFVEERKRAGVKVTIQEAVFDMKQQITRRLELKFAKAKRVMAVMTTRLSEIQEIQTEEQQAAARKEIETFSMHEKAIANEIEGQKSAMHALHKHVCNFENELIKPGRVEFDRVKRLSGAYEQKKRQEEQERAWREAQEAKKKEEAIRAELEKQKTPETAVAIEEIKQQVHIPVAPPKQEKGFRKSWELKINDEKALKTHLIMAAPQFLLIDTGNLKRYLQSQGIKGDWNGAYMEEVLT